MIEIDYSRVPGQNVPAPSDDGWEAPQHKYFGRKLPNGKMEKEPVYVHQEFPRVMYGLEGGKIVAAVVNSEHESMSLGKGWEKSPAAFGVITCPNHEQTLAMRAKERIESLEKSAEKAIDEREELADVVARKIDKRTREYKQAQASE
jgi:hypothetical protein